MIINSITKEIPLVGDNEISIPLSASKHTIAVEPVDGGTGEVVIKASHFGMNTPQNFENNTVDLAAPKAIVVEGALSKLVIDTPATVLVSVVSLR